MSSRAFRVSSWSSISGSAMDGGYPPPDLGKHNVGMTGSGHRRRAAWSREHHTKAGARARRVSMPALAFCRMRRMVRTLGIVVAALLVAGACEGTWTKTANPSPVRAVHAALLRTGKVLLVAGSGNDPNEFAAGSFKTAIYDPTTDTMRSNIATPYDLFCSGHAFLPDGRLLVAGGTTAYQTDTSPYKGEKRVRIFDPVTETYQSAPSMAIGRWYPTVVSRGDGSLVTVAGFDEN